MKTSEVMKVLAAHRGDAVVVCALGMAANEWWGATRSEDSFYMHGAMGFAASFALGLALSIPDTPVWVLNSDGSLSMNTGCLLTEAGQQPKNLKHFVIDNQCYQTVETMPMVNQNGPIMPPWPAAPASGRRRRSTISRTSRAELPAIVAAQGPYFVRLRVEAEPDYQRVPPATYEGPEMKYRFGRAMEKKLGIKVFGPRGY